MLQPLEQQDAVEVVELVLQQAAQQLVALDRDLVPLEVVAGEVDLLGAHDRPGQPGHREAALLVLPLAARLGDDRVDDDAGPRFLVLVVQVEHEQPLLHAHLGRSQAQARGGVHRCNHVLGQARQATVDVGDLGRSQAQHRIAEDPDLVGSHRAQATS